METNRPKLKISWQTRFDALRPLAAIAFGAVAARGLQRRLLALPDEKLSVLQGVFAADLLFVAGAEENLPWADGVTYLGKERPGSPLFVPTNLRPDVPYELFEKSLLLRFERLKPFAVVADKIVPVGEMRPVSRNVLKTIFKTAESGG